MTNEERKAYHEWFVEANEHGHPGYAETWHAATERCVKIAETLTVNGVPADSVISSWSYFQISIISLHVYF